MTVLQVGDSVRVLFMGRERNGCIVRFGRLDGGSIRTAFVAFNDDPLGNSRVFGFRCSDVSKTKKGNDHDHNRTRCHPGKPHNRTCRLSAVQLVKFGE